MLNPKNILDSGSILLIANRMLSCINNEITEHNERTAYIALMIAKNHNLNPKCSINNLLMLALFHTIGFFREDFIYPMDPNDPNIDYFSTEKSIESKYIFGCYYLEYMTPISRDAMALETFNEDYNPDVKKYIYQTDYRSILQLAARVSDFIAKNPDKPLPADVTALAPSKIDPEFAKVFNQLNSNGEIEQKLRSQSYKIPLLNFFSKIKLSQAENNQLIKLLIYILDFKSTATLKHAINTACYSVALGNRMNLNNKNLSILYVAATLHDIGKIATPQRILEAPGKLSEEDMEIMRQHVEHSKRLLHDLVPQVIIDAVYRHHEKLNGKGYPQGLKAEDLTLIQRILTVADITSALNDSRSYKEEFSKEKTLSIIKEMTWNGELDARITEYVTTDFDSIISEQKELQELLRVDYSGIIQKFNNYVFNN